MVDGRRYGRSVSNDRQYGQREGFIYRTQWHRRLPRPGAFSSSVRRGVDPARVTRPRFRSLVRCARKENGPTAAWQGVRRDRRKRRPEPAKPWERRRGARRRRPRRRRGDGARFREKNARIAQLFPGESPRNGARTPGRSVGTGAGRCETGPRSRRGVRKANPCPSSRKTSNGLAALPFHSMVVFGLIARQPEASFVPRPAGRTKTSIRAPASHRRRVVRPWYCGASLRPCGRTIPCRSV